MSNIFHIFLLFTVHIICKRELVLVNLPFVYFTQILDRQIFGVASDFLVIYNWKDFLEVIPPCH